MCVRVRACVAVLQLNWASHATDQLNVIHSGLGGFTLNMATGEVCTGCAGWLEGVG